jgi:putative sigma-54 modulation protein
MQELIDEEEVQEAPEIIRRKKFTLIPMDEREAIEQSQLLGHEDFFVFFNVNSNSVNVLYTRRDGTLGLIETEVG